MITRRRLSKWNDTAASLIIIVSLLAIPIPAGGGSGLGEKHVTLEFKDAEIEDALHMLSRQCGVSIVLGGDIEGTITANLVDIPFERALDVILNARGYHYFWKNGVVIVCSKRMASRVVKLCYIDARKIAESLSRFVSEAGAVKAFTEAATEGVSGQGFSNKLLIMEKEGRIDALVSIVEELDVPPKQVYIEAKLVETTLGDEETLGIRWNLAASMTGSVAPTTFPFPKGTADETRFSPTPDPGDPRLYLKAPFPTGEFFPYAEAEDFVFGKLSAAEFSLVLQAISSRRDINLISSPKIMSLDNKPAEILVGKQIPIAIYERHRETGVMEIIGYDQQSVGVNLWVTPHVGKGDTILLEIAPETSSIVEFIGQYSERPITSTRVARTQVLVRDGETVVIGGLIREVTREIQSKVPVLGDIPLAGYLFRHKSIQKEKVDLLIFITPKILRD